MYKTAIFLAILANATTTYAQSNSGTDIVAKTPYSAYLQDSRGVIVRSGSGLCWRASYWTPADAVLGCDGDLVPPVVSVIAPPIVPQVPVEPVKPAPQEMAAPAKRCDFTLTLNSDQTFNFGSTALKPAAKQRIGTEFRSKLESCAKIDSIVVTGHTDRLGPDAYNQKLSETRAKIVADYLKNSGVTAPVEQRGMGKTQPLRTCEEISGQTKLIACLAPNRRVEIDVRGSSR